jgi:two-component system CheB/CheR fusion protein
MNETGTKETLLQELEELRQQLEEANDTINAIRTGQIDALVVENGSGHQLYTLKTADQAYRIFIEKMKEGAITLNKDNLVVYCNSQFAAMLDVPLARVIGLPLVHFVPQNYNEIFETLIAEGWESESRGELILKASDGRLVPCIISITRLELHEGSELSVVLTDLSMQKEAEQELKAKNEELETARESVAEMNAELENLVKERTKDLLQSREHFKFLADNIPVIVWTTFADGNFNYFNKCWYDYSGMSKDSLNNSDFYQRIHPDDKDRLKETWKNALNLQKRFEIEYRIKGARDGMFRWHLTNALPYFDDANNIVAWFGTSTDIEDQKKELQKKDEFIGIASHELKTPLTSLKSYVQLIARHNDLPPSVQQYIGKANLSINKLHHLVNDLLDVSKIQAGKLQFTLKPIDMSKLVLSCVDNGQHLYPDFNIETEIAPNCMVKGNEERLEQVMMNLINNAVKYSRNEKKIIVRVICETDQITTSVVDFGIGLSPMDQQKIFQRFYRVEDKTFLTSGLGMGLYISAEIISGHGGIMKVNSKIKEGAIFSFILPRIVE